jgi:hypothetical protein
MKIRFLALLLAVAAGSATVLIYASRSNRPAAVPATTDAVTAESDCDSCDMSAAKMEGCPMNTKNANMTATLEKPEVATLTNAGCPYQSGATTNASLGKATATAQVGKAEGDACCGMEAAPAAAAKPAN